MSASAIRHHAQGATAVCAAAVPRMTGAIDSGSVRRRAPPIQSRRVALRTLAAVGGRPSGRPPRPFAAGPVARALPGDAHIVLEAGRDLQLLELVGIDALLFT